MTDQKFYIVIRALTLKPKDTVLSVRPRNLNPQVLKVYCMFITHLFLLVNGDPHKATESHPYQTILLPNHH